MLTANATAGLISSLMALRPPRGSLCLMPSWTFVATAHAAVAAGLEPFFVDVREATWALDPDDVRQSLRAAPRPVGAVVVVAPFGAPVEVAAWEAFQRETAVPVVIDAAAAFDTIRPSHLPAVVSLHATKAFGAGEGGLVLTTDPDLRREIFTIGNFGFWGTRSATRPALNARMSEYHAAAGLAALDEWSHTRSRQARLIARYAHDLARLPRVAVQPRLGEWVGSTCNILIPEDYLDPVRARLLAEGIETMRWWGDGCHRQPAFQRFPSLSLPVTEGLARRVLGLPWAPDFGAHHVERVVSALARALDSRPLLNLRRALRRFG